jgi:NAD-dependent DNA ligase
MARRDYFLQDYLDRESVALNEDGQPPSALNARYRLRRAINEMLGLCKGLLADGNLVDSEITFLNQWFHANEEALANFPAREIYARIQRIYQDGVVSEEEREDLKQLLANVTGTAAPPHPTGITAAVKAAPETAALRVNRSTTLPFDDPEPGITFPGQSFSFTGKFVSGTRSWCANQVSARGGTFHEKPVSSTNVLVIGALGSRDWAHTSFGRKIEAALKYKPPMKIVSEQHWVKHFQS